MGRSEFIEIRSLSMRYLAPPNPLGPSPFARPAMPRGHALLQDIVSEFELLDYCHALTIAEPSLLSTQ